MTLFSEIQVNLRLREYVKNLVIEHSFIDLIDAVDNKVFGFNLFNVFRNNIIALKERFFVEHDSSGGHVPAKIGWKGASAWARYDAATGTLLDTRNVSGVTNPATGRYVFALSGGLSTTSNCITTSLWDSSAVYYRVEEAPNATATNVELRVYDTTDALVKLNSTSAIGFVMHPA